MKTIYKYEIPVGAGQFKLLMPAGAEVLCVQLQRNMPAVWAYVQPSDDGVVEQVSRGFRVFGTGHDIPEKPKLRYVGTYQMAMDMLVFHVFEEVQ